MINTLSIHRLRSLFFISGFLLFVQDAVLAQTALVNVVVLIKDKEDNTFPKEVQLKMKDLKTGKEFTPVFNKADNSFSTPEYVQRLSKKYKIHVEWNIKDISFWSGTEWKKQLEAFKKDISFAISDNVAVKEFLLTYFDDVK